MSDELYFFNGLNASTGDYLIPPLSAAALAQAARGETFAPEHLMELKWRQAQRAAHYGVREGIDPKDISQAGWGVILASDADPAIYDALKELLEHRQRQAMSAANRYREYRGENGYRPNESKNLFLARQGAGPGPVDPDKVPYYLLIVGDPEKIPYSFQFQLDVAYAVGRIHFDTPAEYAQYAHSVVQAETQNLVLPRRAAFFGAANPDDPATQLSAEQLVRPLANTLRAGQTDWAFDSYLVEDATKARLEGLMRADAPPALLFTASHGVGFDLGDPRQLKHQGALVCQEWEGPAATRGRGIPQTVYFAADDVASDARLHGMVAFHFACFGVGTPRWDEFSHLRQGVRERTQIAPLSFLSKLPKRLLAHPRGGALAVIGHIDRAWGSSFLWNKKIEQRAVFESALVRLMQGHPVGSATEFFNERYAELAATLSSELEEMKYGKQTDPVELAALWTANNDARGYAIVGDPAVRLRFETVNGRGGMAQDVSPITLARPTSGAAPSPAATSADKTDAAATTNGVHDSLITLAHALEQLAGNLSTMLQARAQPLEISTALGDARITSYVRADGSMSTAVQGIVGENLLNVHTRLVEQAQRQQVETLQALAETAKQAMEALERIPQ